MEIGDQGQGEGEQNQGAIQARENALRELIEKLKSEIATVQPMVDAARQQLDVISTAKAQAEALLAEVQGKASDSQTYAASQLASVGEIAGHRATAESEAAAISALKDVVEEMRQAAASEQMAASEAAAGAAAATIRATSAAEESEKHAAAITTLKEAADANSVAIEDAKNRALGHTATLKGLAAQAEAVDTRISGYEARLAEFDQRAAAQLETITRLLPGATSAGLASAFDMRRQSFLKPGTRWQWLFVGSIASLVLLAVSGFWGLSKGDEVPSYDEILSMWLVRLPIAAALIWLALHASRESALAKRLEEDYGFKAAMAASFQGFQEQMADIGETAGADSPLRKLCEDTLATIASPPGRIYEKHSLTATPASEMAKTMRDAVPGSIGEKR